MSQSSRKPFEATIELLQQVYTPEDFSQTVDTSTLTSPITSTVSTPRDLSTDRKVEEPIVPVTNTSNPELITLTSPAGATTSTSPAKVVTKQQETSKQSSSSKFSTKRAKHTSTRKEGSSKDKDKSSQSRVLTPTPTYFPSSIPKATNPG